jgi:toxin HigB-1
MIKSFDCKETRKIFERVFSNKFPPEIQRAAYRKLLMLEVSTSLNDLRYPPGNRLEKLTGELEGRLSLRINKQWRLIFVWNQGNAYKVKITDYH